MHGHRSTVIGNRPRESKWNYHTARKEHATGRARVPLVGRDTASGWPAGSPRKKSLRLSFAVIVIFGLEKAVKKPYLTHKYVDFVTLWRNDTSL